ncbi:hypothetical protein J3Q64DRAFT_1764477 [Phycomyces blakesleeanus]|uniref:Large ribosomal subunit protein bL32m n=2 Tax=Phycomyces blakesleeanus TaxID=4837 RepID=A0ABR3AQC3_PHYBL
MSIIARPFALTRQWAQIQTVRFGSLSIGSSGENVTRSTFEVPVWLEPFLWAAPKKKTSHSKKRMRASNKGLPTKENVVGCPGCGNSKLLHHLCKHCYGDIKQKTKDSLAQA